MKYASALVFERLNDVAVGRDWNQSLTDRFFEDMDRDTPAACFIAFPHGLAPQSSTPAYSSQRH